MKRIEVSKAARIKQNERTTKKISISKNIVIIQKVKNTTIQHAKEFFILGILLKNVL